MQGTSQKGNWSGRAFVLVPYLWLVVFFLTPFVIVLKISLSQTAMAQPPYAPVFDLSAGWAGLREFAGQLSLNSFGLLFTDLIYLLSYLEESAGCGNFYDHPAPDRVPLCLRHRSRAA